MKLKRIISGGQVGADQAGLDFAIANKIKHGGFCPKGRISLRGPIPSKYKLIESLTSRYPERTRKNIELVPATLIFTPIPMGRGSKLTMKICDSLHRNYVVNPDLKTIMKFFETFEEINIAGSSMDEYYQITIDSLQNAFNELNSSFQIRPNRSYNN